VSQIRPHVLTLFPSAAGGGAERIVLDQIRFCESARYDYSAVALRKGKLHRQFATHACYSCAHAGTTFNPLALAKVNRLIRAREINLLHTQLQEADFYGFLLKRLNPQLVWISTRQNADDFRTRWFWRTLNANITKSTNRVIAVSAAVSGFVAEHERIPLEKLVVIHNAIDLGRFATLPSREAARAPLGLSPEDFVVGIVGRLSPQKGHTYLLQAAARLAADVPRLRLLIVGEGQLRGRLERQARDLGIAERISFAGFRSDMPNLYPAMDLLAMPSLFEGLPLTLLEALCCGLVAVGARAPGIVDVIGDGNKGLLVDVGDVEGLAEAIRRVYRREYDPEMPRRAREAARAEYGIDTYLRRLETLYYDELARPGP
jgi:glycosyltransferase involved in cell wall biosynthesis